MNHTVWLAWSPDKVNSVSMFAYTHAQTHTSMCVFAEIREGDRGRVGGDTEI